VLEDAWLSEIWPVVAASLPPAPADVLEIGCGPLGGFVPELTRAGYAAVGIDPAAPDSDGFERCGFEDYRVEQPSDAVIACTSLHHVADLGAVLDKMASVLVPGGRVIVVEWARELFDEATARWCFARLAPQPPDADTGWLHRLRDDYVASAKSWEEHCAEWAEWADLHLGSEIVRGLDVRFDRLSCSQGPYFWPDLAHTSVADEQFAIDSGQIRATAIRYIGASPAIV
jgi:SAM-dependent methyltransferase